MLGFAKVEKKLVSKKNSLLPFIDAGKTMEKVIGKRATDGRDLRVVEHLQCGKHCVDVLYLVSHLIIKTHMIIYFFFQELLGN